MMTFLQFLFLFSPILALPIPNFLIGEPETDPFYAAPSNLAQLANGEVYNQRQVILDLELSVSFAGAYQIAYRTTNTENEPEPNVATVLRPLVPSGQDKLFSYQLWEDADQLKCSPSYTLLKGLLSPDQITGILDTAVIIDFALSQGWTVVVPDHEGVRSAFIAGYEQGQAGLDGIKAALNFLKWDYSTPTAMYGYSGGASATAWMANLQPSYFPELNVVGAAHGGTPVDLRATVIHLDQANNSFSGFIVGAFTGLLKAYPDRNVTIWPHLYQEFKDRINTMLSGENCVVTEILTMGFTAYHTLTDVSWWTFPDLVYVMDRETLFSNTTGIVSVPKFPRYIFHADGDEVIPATAVRQYVTEQCSQGANIQYVPWSGNDHISMEFLGIPDALQFLIQAFEGATPDVVCGMPNNDVLTLGSELVGATIGQAIADALTALSGFVYDGITFVFDPLESYVKGITAEA